MRNPPPAWIVYRTPYEVPGPVRTQVFWLTLHRGSACAADIGASAPTTPIATATTPVATTRRRVPAMTTPLRPVLRVGSTRMNVPDVTSHADAGPSEATRLGGL